MVAPDSPQANAQLMFWWIIWSAFLGGPVTVYLLMGHVPPDPQRQANCWSIFPVWCRYS